MSYVLHHAVESTAEEFSVLIIHSNDHKELGLAGWITQILAEFKA
jgi:hypothetical protein